MYSAPTIKWSAISVKLRNSFSLSYSNGDNSIDCNNGSPARTSAVEPMVNCRWCKVMVRDSRRTWKRIKTSPPKLKSSCRWIFVVTRRSYDMGRMLSGSRCKELLLFLEIGVSSVRECSVLATGPARAVLANTRIT